MADERLKIDSNSHWASGGIGATSGEILNLRVNDTTKGLVVDTTTGSVGSTSTRTTITPALTAQTLAADTPARKGLRIVHTAVDPTQNCWISTGTATSTNFFEKKQGNFVIELFDNTTWAYTGAWTLISDVASGTTQIFQLT